MSDNVAIINATDLSPIIEHTQVKEIKEIVNPPCTSALIEVSLKVAELPTTTPIEVKLPNCPHLIRCSTKEKPNQG